MKFSAYPSYKPSDIEWLGDVPEHWETRRLSNLAKYGRKTFTDGDWIESPFIVNEGIRLIQTGNIGIGNYKEQGFRFISEETFRDLRCTEVFPEDILICRLADPVGRACLAPEIGVRMIASVDVCILKIDTAYNGSYLVYSLSSDAYLNFLAAICRGGTRDRVSRTMLGQIRVIMPPLPEQQAIVRFLDRETDRIDALISKKEKLIELLQEKRTALISHAVIKGLDPSAPMKNSGVEWLGDVPAHWEVKRLKYSARINASTISESTDAGFVISYIDIASVDSNGIVANSQEMCFENAPSRARRVVHDGDTILSTVRTYLKAIAYVHDYPANTIVSTGFAVLSPKHFVASRFLFRLIQSEVFVQSVVANSEGVGYPAISPTRLGCLPIWIPPIDEQQAIVVYIDEKTTQIDALIVKVKQHIEKLREYRIALISAAVMGKIDVREEVG